MFNVVKKADKPSLLLNAQISRYLKVLSFRLYILCFGLNC
jgi:hypothetical protein